MYAVARAIGVEPERIAWQLRPLARETVITVAVIGPLSPEENGRLTQVCKTLSGAGVRLVPAQPGGF